MRFLWYTYVKIPFNLPRYWQSFLKSGFYKSWKFSYFTYLPNCFLLIWLVLTGKPIIPGETSMFSCTHWLFGLLTLWTNFSYPLPIFVLDYFFLMICRSLLCIFDNNCYWDGNIFSQCLVAYLLLFLTFFWVSFIHDNLTL